MPDNPQISDSHRDRERVLELVNLHGWNATAFQTLEQGYSYFFHDDDACVAYVDTGGAWVVAGAPIADEHRIGEVTAAFLQAARIAKKRCCFFATESRLHEVPNIGLHSIRIGEQPAWDPRGWTEILADHRSLREQLRRARAKGVTTREVTVAELEGSYTRDAIARVAERWLATKDMAPMDFLVRIEPFTFPAHRRCFVAELDGHVIGFAGVVPVPARGGWFIEDLVRDPRAPNGTGELMVDAVMRWAASNGCEWLTLGLAPLAGHVPPLLHAARKWTAFLYDFDGLHRYKSKLRPHNWSPIYLSYPPTQGVLVSIVDALAAFTRGGFLRFGWRSLLRGPTAVLRGLAFLLVPWTLLLALAPTGYWFSHGWMKWGWVVFDVLLAAGLFQHLRKPAPLLLTALCVAVTGDALLTLSEATLWNLSRARGLGDIAILFLACAAPAVAAVALWGARRSHLLAQ